MFPYNLLGNNERNRRRGTGERVKRIVADDLTEHCARCGACKARCPSYGFEPHEAMSPRGRLALIAMLETGRLSPSHKLRHRIDTCLHCGHCDASCPVQLDIQEILFRGKTRIPSGRVFKRMSRLSLNPARTDLLFNVARVAHSLVYRPLQRIRNYRYVPAPAKVPFRNRHKLFRDVDARGRVALFVGCSINYLYPEIGEDLLDILLSLGYEVVIRQGESCCGAPLREMGFHDVAADLARRNLDLFAKMHVEAIISACPTCTLTLKLQYPKMITVPRDFASRVCDVNQFLSRTLDIELLDQGPVAYHDPCHLAGALSVRSEPRELIRSTGASLLENSGESLCCGFGGAFGFRHYSMSREIGTSCVNQVLPGQVHRLVTSCPGCKMQFDDILGGREGTEVLHIVQYLRRAMTRASEQDECVAGSLQE